jgi:hypothetical protein
MTASLTGFHGKNDRRAVKPDAILVQIPDGIPPFPLTVLAPSKYRDVLALAHRAASVR